MYLFLYICIYIYVVFLYLNMYYIHKYVSIYTYLYIYIQNYIYEIIHIYMYLYVILYIILYIIMYVGICGAYMVVMQHQSLEESSNRRRVAFQAPSLSYTSLLCYHDVPCIHHHTSSYIYIHQNRKRARVSNREGQSVRPLFLDVLSLLKHSWHLPAEYFPASSSAVCSLLGSHFLSSHIRR